MEKSIITTGKTIDLAVAAALAQLGLDRDSISVEVLENPKSGFLGFNSSPAKIKATYEVPDPEETVPEEKPEPEKPAAPAPALSSQSRSKPKKPEERSVKPAVQSVRTPGETGKSVAAQAGSRKSPEQKSEPKIYAPAAPGSMEEKIETFVKGLLEHMGSDAVPHAAKTEEDTYRVELVGENLGMLIGRRGDTLDAIQHLTNYTLNRDAGKRARISIDAENYRGKREESLQRLAHKVAGKVVKYRRNITLEPMNSYERHVIHAALQDYPEVTTYSTGTEPNRRIVVAYSKYKSVEKEES